MNSVMKLKFVLCACMVICLGAVSVSFAQEVVSIDNAKDGYYSITAYNYYTKTFYQINGQISSDSAEINVPQGTASSLTISLGKRTGIRNLFQNQDPRNPIFGVSIKSDFELGIRRLGQRSSSDNNVFIDGVKQIFQRKSPQ